VRLRAVRLGLREPLRTAHGTVRERHGVWIGLEDPDGAGGQGAAFPIGGFGLEPLATCDARLSALAAGLVREGPAELDAWLDRLDAWAPDAPCARSALDAALHDLVSRRRGLPLAEAVGGGAARGSVAVAALLTGEDEATLEASVERALAAGHGAAKLKVGARPAADDRARVARVRAAAGPELALRLDANGAWAPADARRRLAELAPFDVQWIEQPVSGLRALEALRAESPIPIAADEDVVSAAAACEALERGAADVLVVKPAACGGLRAAGRIARRAAAAGVRCIASSLLDSGLGVALALHAAAAWAPEPPACGLATGGALRDDLVALPAVAEGRLPLPAGPGLGVAATPATLERLAVGPLREVSA